MTWQELQLITLQITSRPSLIVTGFHALDIILTWQFTRASSVYHVGNTLSRLRRTVSAFSRSAKLTRLLKSKQADLGVPQHKLIHDEPTRWGSAYDMVERFLEQQQAVCAVLTDNRNKWHLMPKDLDVTTMEALKNVLV